MNKWETGADDDMLVVGTDEKKNEVAVKVFLNGILGSFDTNIFFWST